MVTVGKKKTLPLDLNLKSSRPQFSYLRRNPDPTQTPATTDDVSSESIRFNVRHV